MRTNEVVHMAEEKARFQGKVIASVSHELKNALATVSESAGLLSDILTGSGLEGGVREESLACAEAIGEDLRRSFDIIRTLNTFAHTADDPVCAVDVVDLVELVTTLVGYISYARQTVAMHPANGPIRIRTCPLLLGDLLYRVLDDASRLTRRRAAISVEVSCTGGAEVAFRGLGCRNLDEVVSDESRRVLDALHGGLKVDLDGGEICIRLPSSIEDGSRT